MTKQAKSKSGNSPVHIRAMEARDMKELIKLNAKAFPLMTEENVVWSERQLSNHMRIFPEGQLVAEIDGRLVGGAASLIVHLGTDPYRPHTYAGITDGGYFHNHDPRGDTLYGADVYVDPDCQGKGIGALLYEARRELCRRLTDRRLENAQFGPSGVEDRYIFMPGADVEVIGVEGGRDDLSRNTEECVVFQVTYPAPERALRDEQGQPIRSLKTRVWVSREGFVLKAGVLGDAEVDPASFQYDWHAST